MFGMFNNPLFNIMDIPNAGYTGVQPYNRSFVNAMTGYQPQNVPALPEGYSPNPAAPQIRYDEQPGMFGGLGFEPMSMSNLANLGISNPFAMEFRTPRYDQPIQPFGMHTLDPFGYQSQFPAGNVATPQQPRDNGMAALLSQLPKAESWGEQIALQRMGDSPSAPAMMQFMQDYGIDPYTNKRVPGYNRMKWNVPEGHYDGG